MERQEVKANNRAEEDSGLLRRYAQTGDQAAFNELVERYRDFAFRLALRLCGNEEDAEDIVQQVFLEIMRRAGNYSSAAGTVRSWVGGFVVNFNHLQHRSQLRRRKNERAAGRAEPAPQAESPTTSSLENDEVKRNLRAAVEALPERYRLPVTLHYYEGLPIAEIVPLLGLRERTIYAQISKGLTMLRRRLGAAGLGAAALPALLREVGRTAVAKQAPAGLVRSLSALKANAAKAGAESLRAAGTGLLTGKTVLVATVTLLVAAAGATAFVSFGNGAAPAGKSPSETTPKATAAGTEKAALSSPRPLFYRRWTFEDGIPKGFIINNNVVTVRPKASGSTLLLFPPKKYTFFDLPVKLPEKPCLLTMKSLVLKLGNFNVSAYRRVCRLPHSWIKPFNLKRRTPAAFTAEVLFDGRYSVKLWNGKVTEVMDYEATGMSDRIYLCILNIGLVSIELRELRPDEIRPELTDPRKLIADGMEPSKVWLEEK